MNEEAKSEEQAPAFGPGTKTDDITIDYKPAEKPEQPGKSGEDGEADGSEGSGETDETENPDGTYVKGDVIDNSKKDEATGKDGKIGTATKEETPDSSSSTTVVDPDAEVKKGDPVVGKDEDGNTTITTPTETTGTETTTTTGTGKADSSTTITDTKKGEEINLDDELGKDVRPDWKTDKDAKLGGYTVDKVEPAKDGNSKTLTLKKTSEPETKEMSAEDVAKLLDVPEDGVEKKTDDEGKTTYILKKEETSTDENGNTVTRVTYYKITGNTVETTTETTLKLKVEKGTDKRTEDLDTPIQQPDIKDKETEKVLLPSGKLESILEDPTTVKKDDNTYTYTETIPNEDGITIREYTITKTDEARDLTYQELAERLGEGFTADQDGVYYKGEKLTFEQMEAKRHALRYQVQIKETHKTFDQVSGKTEAETAAKTEAIKGALRNAAKKYDITLTEDDLKDIKLTGGDLTVTREGKTYTFHYTEAGVEYSTPTSTGETTVDGKDAEDVRETTVTGTAYVTKGTISWSKPGESGTYTVSGTLKPGDNHIASKPAKPTGDNVTFTQEGDAAVYIVTTENEDGSITETIYTFREAVVSLSSPEAKQAAWEALAKAENKTVQQLKDEGYTISDIKFDSIAKSTWTVETRTRTTKTTDESLNQKILKAEGDPTWTLEGTTLKIKGGDTYKDLKKNADGTYTATKEEEGGKKVTYTFTLGEVKDLDDDTIKAMLAKEFNVSVDAITLKDGKATYEDGKTTVTIDYSNLSKKTLKIDKSVSEAVSVTETIKDGDKAALEAAQEKLYQELKKKVESIHLNEGEELWIGDLQIKDIENQKEQIIEKFTTAVSHENMSQQALIAALNAQADEAKNQTVVVNKGTKYEEKLDNYYSGDKNLQHKPKDPPKYGTPGEGDDITHLDLASGAKMDKLPDKDGKVTQTDCVLLAKGQKLEWNYDADKLVKGDSSNTTVGLQDYISKDTEDGKGYHYEYNRSGDNNNPNKSAFYKLTGTVAYDALKNGDDIIEYTSKKDAVDAYLKAVGRTDESYWTLTQKQRNEILGTYVVPLYSSSPFPTYQVYKKTAEMTSYGYMTRDANTCVNATFSRQYEDSWFTSEWDYAGGYDLMISDLVQVSEGQVVGQTQSSIKSLWAPLAIRSTQSLENKSLQLNTKQTSTPVTTDPVNLGSGYEEEGSFTYDVSYKHTDTYPDNCNKGVQGTGTGKYKTFTQLLKEKFSGKGETTYDKGSVSYTHRTTDKVNTTPVSKETVTTTDAHVGYNYTSIETRTVTVNGEETVIVPPVTPPETPVEDETPDEVVTPETPELPPVQDATPDDAAPETPVLPSDAVLPAVQDALPQTGVNWMAALGMAFSGMLLTIAGAFASLKYKEKH